MKLRLLFFIFIASICRAQTPGKSVVFKVRAPQSGCSIICEHDYFPLEALNPVQIKVFGKNKNIEVRVPKGAKIMSIKNNTYYIRFTQPGSTVISVFAKTDKGLQLMSTKKMDIKSPDVFLCGIKLDSTSKTINFNGPNIYAYSKYYKQNLPVLKFEMYYIEDTTKVSKRNPPLKMKSDTCLVTPEMKNTILGFQPNFNELYFHNIVCKAPDGSKRILDPIRLNIQIDTADTEHLSLVYTVKKKAL